MYQESLPVSRNISYFNKNVGVLRSDRVFVTVRRREHIFRIFDGLGMSVGLLRKLRSLGCSRIIFVLDLGDSQYKYSSSTDAFFCKGRRWTDKQADTQLILPFSEMIEE